MSDLLPVRLNVAPGGVATLALNRPEQLNAFNLEMIAAWRAALEAAESDDRVKVVVITGAGRAFCAAGDFEEMGKFRAMDALERNTRLYRNVHRIPLALQRMDKPGLPAINGAARGAGLDMALMCDIRLMAQPATLAESCINTGLIAGDAGSWFLPRLIGAARALELFWTGRVVGAEEAERIGTVNRRVPDAEPLPAAYKLARTIAAKPTQAVRFFRRAVYQSQTSMFGGGARRPRRSRHEGGGAICRRGRRLGPPYALQGQHLRQGVAQGRAQAGTSRPSAPAAEVSIRRRAQRTRRICRASRAHA